MRELDLETVSAVMVAWRAGEGRKAMARRHGLEPNQVRLLVRGLGLRRTRVAVVAAAPVARLDTDFIRRWWPHSSSRRIAAALGMSDGAVRAVARRLGLPAHGRGFRASVCPLRVAA